MGIKKSITFITFMIFVIGVYFIYNSPAEVVTKNNTSFSTKSNFIDSVTSNIEEIKEKIEKENKPVLIFSQTGIASWYGPGFQGRKTANGERYNMYTSNPFTAAHKTLSFNTMVKVTLLSTEKSITVRINDRGPFIRGRIIDLNKAAKIELGMNGLGKVKIEVFD